MTKIYFLTVFVVLQIYTCSKKEIDDFDYAMEKMNDKGQSVSGACPTGRWRRLAVCSSNPNPPYSYFIFDKNGTGKTINPDCNGICTPLTWNFTWKKTSSTTISYTFTGADDMYCTGVNQGHPNPPANPGPFTMNYQCIDENHCKFQTSTGMFEFERD